MKIVLKLVYFLKIVFEICFFGWGEGYFDTSPYPCFIF